MSSAIADRAKILGTLETLVIGAAGGLLFLWLNLPGGLISGAMVTVGIAALAGRPVTMPPILTQSVLVLLGITLGSLVSRQLIQHVSAYPLDHRAAGARHLLLDLRLQLLSAALPWLGPDLGAARRQPRRAVADRHPCRREGRRRRGHCRGADRARDHSHRRTAAAAGADRDSALCADLHDGDRLAGRTGRADRGVGRRRAGAAAGEFSGGLDVRRNDRFQPYCTAPG